MSLHGKCSTQNKQMRIRGLAILLSIVFFWLAINSSTNAHEKGPPQGDESKRSFLADERRTIYVN